MEKIDEGGFVEIPLSKGQIAIIDKGDQEKIAGRRWHSSHGYAVSYNGIGNPRLYMHRIINNTPEGLGTDHINGDKLDNRKTNLRNANQSMNCQNRTTNYGSSRFKGVSFKKENKKWMSYIKIAGKMRHLGYFEDEIAAAKRYNLEAKIEFGEFACLNKY